MKPKIFIALSTFAKEGRQPLEMLEASGYPFTCNVTGQRLTKEQVITQAKGFEGIIAGLEPYDQEVLEKLPGLQCISRCGVGVDSVDMAFARQKGVTVLNTPDIIVQPVAELTVAMIFDLLRRLTAYTQLMRQHKWERLTGFQLAGKTVGIIGLGRIGKRVAELVTRLEAKVVAYDVVPDRAWAASRNVGIVDLNVLLKASDVVTIHVNSTNFCLGVKDLGLMKKGAFLVNTARGSLVDEKALKDLLRNGHLAGAALDAYAHEPYGGPLCDLPNVVLTPHVGTLTVESRQAMEMEAVNNLLSFLKKGSL